MTLTQKQTEVLASLVTARGDDYVGDEAVIETVLSWYPNASRDEVIDTIEAAKRHVFQFRVL